MCLYAPYVSLVPKRKSGCASARRLSGCGETDALLCVCMYLINLIEHMCACIRIHSQAKTLFKKLCASPGQYGASAAGAGPSRMSYESGPMVFHYIVEHGVCYLTVTDRAYPKKLAYQYLAELQAQFDAEYRSQVDTASRPYAFVRFDTAIQRTKKLYMDSRTQRNIDKLNEDLSEVHMVMTKNINDVLGQGERLDHISRMSGDLASESKKYHSKARDLSRYVHTRTLLHTVS